MPLETASYISDLEPANPASTDQLAQADEHLRLIKSVLQNTFPNIDGPVTVDQDTLNAPLTIPVGLISIWYGSALTVPSGWAICDGSTVLLSDGSGSLITPNLADRTVIGAGTIAGQGVVVGSATSVGDTGSAGSHTHTIGGGGAHGHDVYVHDHALTAEQIPSHYHFAVTKAQSSATINENSWISEEGIGSYLLKGTPSPAGAGRTSSVGAGQAHTHGISIGGGTHSHTIADTGAHTHAVNVSLIQPSMGLYYIIKV